MKALTTARLAFALVATLAVTTFASMADAQNAWVYGRTSLRAGPDRGYPQVAWLGGGSTVYVHGCVRGYHWCDVSSGPYRGWVNARNLQYTYQNRRVLVYGNGYGFPVVGFTVGSYWDSYYRDRPWYGHRSHWNDWRPGRPAPRGDYYVEPRPHHHYSAPHAHAVAPHAVAPRPYVREAAPQQFHAPRQHQQYQPQVQVRERPQAQPQPRPQGRVHGHEHAGNLNINGSLR